MLSKRAFTLTELLVVIAILAILAAITYPVVRKAVFRSQMTSTVLQLKQLHLATKMYQSDHDGEARYGSRYEMGLPDDYVSALAGYKVPYRMFKSPCGVHPQADGGIENAWSNTWWEASAPQYREQIPLWFDLNCNEHNLYLYNEHIPRRGIAVLLSGTAVTKVGLGAMFLPSFYGMPGE